MTTAEIDTIVAKLLDTRIEEIREALVSDNLLTSEIETCLITKCKALSLGLAVATPLEKTRKTQKKSEVFKYDKKDITTDNDCGIEREYDEIEGMPIYGWCKKTRDCVYYPRAGLLTKPPSYRWAGENWKAVLLERHDQQSVHGGDPDLALDDFTGTFPNSAIAQRQKNIAEWVASSSSEHVASPHE